MEEEYRPNALLDAYADIDFTEFNLPFSGGINYTTSPDGSRAEIDLNKTFEGGMGSVTPSIGVTEENSVDSKVKSYRAGLDADYKIGELDLTGSLFGQRDNFNGVDVGTFTKIGLGARMGMFDVFLNRQKQTGYEPDYYGSVGINVGNNSRLQYSDSNRGDPTVNFNYNRKF